MQFMRVVSMSNFSPKQRAKTNEALPLPVPTNRPGRFWENFPRYGLANKFCVCGILLRSATGQKTQLDMTDFGHLYGYSIHFRCSVWGICDFIAEYRKLGTQFCYAFELLHLGV